ncbi:alpha-tectorin-like [Oryzias latipes]|uniref:alpha-tectorin-like n=1 Tax=Oryzias latipes TaxID=8090 RepID=UPI0005CBC710|nr:alpha-tectorin-like [Oryzias latipes]
MLRLLLHLLALATLTGVVSSTYSKNLNIASCPIRFYAKTYNNVYINFTSSGLMFCFDDFYDPAKSNDCIKGPVMDEAKQGVSNKIFQITSLDAVIRNELKTLTSHLKCYLYLSYFSGGRETTLNIYQFGNQTALGVKYSDLSVSGSGSTDYPRNFSTLVNNKEVDFVVAVESVLDYYKDITGCRLSGYGVRLNTTQYTPETCSTDSCSLSAVGTSTTCGDGTYCNGRGSCKKRGLCTVTGPTVIDFRGQLNSVSDRCEYTLLQDQSTGFTLKANFLERRRRDVSFVDSLTLDFSEDDDIQLLQGQMVMVGGSPVTLSGSVQTFNGVGLSKDQTGVTAVFSPGGSSFSVFFDGTTAQIYIDVLAGHSFMGLCENSSSSSSSRLSSDSSCQQQYVDPADDTINSTAVIEQCNILKSSPFSSCNAVVDPQPYIAACTETLCKYPAVDGLRCQFLGAYAKACQKRQVNIQNWETAAQCSSSTVMCPGRTCSDHEFCGQIDNSTATGCRCKAIFAAPYINSSSFGAPTVCQHNSASLTLVGCLLEQRGIDYSLLTLLDKTCKGQVDETTHLMTFNFTSDNCGTIVTTKKGQVIFTNAVTLKDKITRKDQAYIEFSCLYKKPEVNHVAFRIQDSPVVQTVVSGDWNHTVTMKAFADSMRTQMLDRSYQVQLNQKIWVELKSSGLDENLISTVTDSCWATNQPSSDSSQKYFLIKNGCANIDDQTVQVERNGDGTLNYFSFNMFKFTDESRDLYLHCKLQLCLKQEGNCIPVCSAQGKRRRRSAKYRQRDAAFLSMGWST